ncbi:MAG: glycosyltransferase family 2 protein [Pyrinomonadaceae bacterium]
MVKNPSKRTPTKSVLLSVVVVSLYSHRLLRKCLNSILANQHLDEVEILVADCCSDDPVSSLMENYPNVCFLQFPQKAGIPVLAGAGIKQSKGEIIALTDSSCVVSTDWVSEVRAAHRSSSLVIGGAVDVSGPMKMIDWAAYFCEYGQFMPPLKAGRVEVLPGINISFKRSALEKQIQYVEPEFWKTYWCEKLKEEGVELFSEPAMLVHYAKTFEVIPFFIRRFHHGRCFAGMRSRQLSFSKRMVYVGGSLTLPLILLYRTIATILTKKQFLTELVLSFPYIVLAIGFWSIGEFCGYLAGKGKSCELIY